MQFLYPLALILLIPLLVVNYFLRTNNKTSNVLRIIFIILLILALSSPQIIIKSSGGVLIIIADRSASMPQDSEEKQSKIIEHIQKKLKGDQLLGVIGFDKNVFIEKMPDKTKFTEFKGLYNNDGSSLYNAVSTAKSLIPKDRKGRILILSDGRVTGGNSIHIKNIPIDFHMMQKDIKNDLSILYFNLPDYAESQETFQFSAGVYSPYKSNVKLKLYRNNKLINNSTKNLKKGINRFYFRDRAFNPGNTIYNLKIEQIQNSDTILENNTAKSILTVKGIKPILHIGNSGSNLIKLANNAGIKIINKKPSEIGWSLSELTKYKAIILENTAATEIGYKGLISIKNFVQEGSGSLLITGGRKSFGRGGYFGSPLEEIIPVSMELRKEHKKITNAVVIALDRSGSMAAPVSGNITKMDLANKGSASVLELLTEYDSFGLIAVDTSPHVVVPMEKVKNKNITKDKILKINSQGGGIYIYNALLKAGDMISKTDAGAKHIILFADASDSEEPGNYRHLIKTMRKAGITISVIGLGTEHDSDAGLLKEIGKLGGGNVYFTTKAEELPLLFTQDAMTMFKESFIEERTNLMFTDAAPLIVGTKYGTPPSIGGYNTSYIKPESLSAVITNTQDKFPILSFWQTGSGRCAAYTGEVDGKYSGNFAKWEKAGDFYLSLIRWINVNSDNDKDMYAFSKRQGNSVIIKLELDPDRQKDPFAKIPQLIQLTEENYNIHKNIINLNWLDKDTLGYKIDLNGSSVNHFIIQTDKKSINLSSYCLPYPMEFRPEYDKNRGIKSLRKLSKFSGGMERLKFDNIYKDIPKSKKYFSLIYILAIFCIVILLMDVYSRRIGFSWLILNISQMKNNILKYKLKTVRPVIKKEKTKTTKTKKKKLKSIKETEQKNENKEETSVLSALKSIKKDK